jgi:hypothetical protein
MHLRMLYLHTTVVFMIVELEILVLSMRAVAVEYFFGRLCDYYHCRITFTPQDVFYILGLKHMLL